MLPHGWKLRALSRTDGAAEGWHKRPACDGSARLQRPYGASQASASSSEEK